MSSAMKILEDRARRALGHKDFNWLRTVVPAHYHNSPQVMASMLAAAAQGDPALAQAAHFQAAFGALRSWCTGQHLADRAARIYHAPEVHE